MARQGNGTIIIKKVKKGGHGGHHGGAWKVAYADFVTAMMAFFLLLWLLNVTTDVQKRGIADYFQPTLAAKSAAEREERQFAAAEFALRQAMQDIPDLKSLAENLVVDRTPEGLRIQIVDQDKTSMFALGSSEMSEPAKKLMALVTQVVQRLPNKLSVSGHTDGTPFSRTGNYGNWELSADRANASRRALVGAGLPVERIAKVV